MTTMLRKLFTAGIAGILMLTAVACTSATASSAPSSSAPSSSASSSAQSAVSDTANAQPDATGSEQATEGAPYITVEEAKQKAGGEVKLYRGTILDFAVNNEGKTVWMLQQDIGANYGAASLNVAVDESLPVGSDGRPVDIANGSHLEVFYTEMTTPEGSLTPEVKAVAVNLLMPADMTTYNGKVTELIPAEGKPGSGSFMLEPIDGGQPTIFHYSPETVFEGITADAVKVGDELHILYNGVSTRSLPPQSSAMTVLPYASPESCLLVPKQPVAELPAGDQPVIELPIANAPASSQS